MLSTIGFVTDLLIGFSIVASAILLVAYLFLLKSVQRTRVGALSCTVLLFSLSGLQLFHYGVWQSEPALFDSKAYIQLLLLTPPAFYLFSRSVLLPDKDVHWLNVLHFVPALANPFLPSDFIMIVAFALGAGYSLWFVSFVYGMRRSVRRFRFEMFFFSFFAAQALLVFLLAISLPYLDETVFHLVYANFTAIALVLIVATLIVYPEVLNELSSAAQLAYSKSTLTNVDVDDALARLERLMSEERLYQNESLNLAMVAEALGIGAHQLSELVNTHHGLSFSRYIRERRVEEAKRLLREDPRASVLSISMTTGFRSQSNFYAAFQELTGESPGAYRKRS